MVEATDIDWAFTGGLGSDLAAPHGMDLSIDDEDEGMTGDGPGSDNASEGTDGQDVEMTDDHAQRSSPSQGHGNPYPPIDMTDADEEDPRRPRLLPSDDGHESDASSVASFAYTASSFDGRANHAMA
ncbi:hypothetical protein NLG97_g8321 [Lecanicillium saksenae]|uniref:Uncharacterized protein n=1 Tax=Lecanicillium saksenae TaxID=468837 RepID=A0ACC1QJA1_9HYPO|nr:hypothetical protein NLG97_g8321 [Lecanicillium saksenae]